MPVGQELYCLGVFHTHSSQLRSVNILAQFLILLEHSRILMSGLIKRFKLLKMMLFLTKVWLSTKVNKENLWIWWKKHSPWIHTYGQTGCFGHEVFKRQYHFSYLFEPVTTDEFLISYIYSYHKVSYNLLATNLRISNDNKSNFYSLFLVSKLCQASKWIGICKSIIAQIIYLAGAPPAQHAHPSQVRPLKWQRAAAATAFYFSKSR